MQDYIVIKGAKEHNLKNVDLKIPREKITVITGPSGSGKSTLAMDIIYAEGQRRYVESLSTYARQFLEKLQKPDVEYIEGLSPAIAIDQKAIIKSPRSTVGTITEIYDYMRVLYAKVGVPICYKCNTPIETQDIQNIINSILHLPTGSRIQILSPIVRGRKGEHKKELRQMRIDGFVRARIDGFMYDLTNDIELNKNQRHTIEVVIDRLIIRPSIERHIRHAIDTSLRYADVVIINLVDEGKDLLFSRKLACPVCGINYPEIEPRLFSFNSKYGACPCCLGLGITYINVKETSFDNLKIDDFEGLLNSSSICKCCKGLRLRKEALSIKINDKNIAEFAAMTVKDALNFLENLNLTESQVAIGRRILKEVKNRLTFLNNVGLSYMTLDRGSHTLSGGESQRVRLANHLGSSLTGVLYVLDEPTIGLHPKDCLHMFDSLQKIRDSLNTVIIVEHNEEIIKRADHIIDMGPQAGLEGGYVVAEGKVSDICETKSSITGNFLSRKIIIEVPSKRRKPSGFLEIIGASEFNLKDINVSIPLGVICCVTGVSGSGKSTLIFEVLYKALSKILHKSNLVPGKYTSISGVENINKIICVDQTPLGRTSRSNPATYAGIFEHIRRLFSMLPDSRVRGYTQARFSFNVSGGRCEACEGEGQKRLEMHFLPDVYVICDRCKGKRYNKETLSILYKNKSISDVLDMTVSEALEFFSSIPVLKRKLQVLVDMGLGYLKLGQPATTLSGGEAQRLKLSKELSKKATTKTLYILDEPTTGLHFIDILRLINTFNKLVEMGNSIIVIEHDLDIIKSSDYIIDLGPGAGDEGGKVIAFGTPEEVAKNNKSYTGKYLLEKLRSESKRDLRTTAES
ncbi:MAG: excinuclease ABC subunit UvrA [Thermodesulfovibrionales bacterium]|nr:excinuclease ABC subunit UvrA [Thermodesulfovibrionales bacterium]